MVLTAARFIAALLKTAAVHPELRYPIGQRPLCDAEAEVTLPPLMVTVTFIVP
jgi:hypothetical protein